MVGWSLLASERFVGDEFSGYGKIVKETLQSLSYFKGCNEIKNCVS